MVSIVQRKGSDNEPPLLTITAPDHSTSTAVYHQNDGSSVEISSLGLPLDDGLLDVNLTSVESKSCNDLRPSNVCETASRNITLTLPTPNKSTSLPNHQRGRRLSNAPQGGAVFLHHRRKQKSFDISMLSRDNEELTYLSRGRSPSPSPDDRASPTNKVDFCDYVVEEILVTEQQYVHDLEDIVKGYLEYSRTCSPITNEDIADIFSNILDIYHFHISFLKDLEQCDEEAVAMAKCFIKRGAEFDIYAKYVTNYPNSITCLTRLLRKAIVNDAYRKQQLILGHGLPLGSYLHKPVQRILKYHLLLQNLLKHFPEESLGRETITASLQCMTDCAHNINELKRSHEHAMRIQEIQSMLYNFEGYNLLDFGKLVIEGDLRMHGAKSFRHIYLFEKGVIICKKREDGAMSCKTTIMCHNLMLIESIPREPLSFHLIPYDNPRQQNTFQAKTLEQKREWCSLVKKYILESYEMRIPEKAKELLLSLTGKSESDEKFAKQFKAFTLKSHQTPDYIEKKRRKSQPYVSSSAGDTLPRTKKRVRKASADPLANPSLFMSPPTARTTRSMSSPIRPEDLTAHTLPREFNLAMSYPAPKRRDNSHNPPLGTDIALHAVNGAIENVDVVLNEERYCDNVESDLNTPQHRKKDENSNLNGSLLPPFIIPIVKITGTDDIEAQELFDSQAMSSDQPEISNHQDLHESSRAANTCMEMQQTSSTSLPRAILRNSPSHSPHLYRRHSLSDLKTDDEGTLTPAPERAHDEYSTRAKLLQRLLEDRHGMENPTWCPEIASLAKRYQTPLIRRADSYTQAVMDYTPSMHLWKTKHLAIDSDAMSESKESLNVSRKSSFNSDSCDQEDSARKESILSQKSGDGDTLRKGKTETSLLLNKLSQLKDLLKRSPIKLFKDSMDQSQHHLEHNDLFLSQSIVGRRLSNSDTSVSMQASAHHCAATLSKSDSSGCSECVSHPDSLTTVVAECEEESEDQDQLIKVDNLLCNCENGNCTCANFKPALPLKLHQRNSNRDSIISLTSTNGGTLERAGTSRQGYSTDNLADVEENDYENVGYGDNLTFNGDVSNEEPIYDIVADTTEHKRAEGDDEIPPELPPLPEFLIQKRLVKAMSVSSVDDVMKSERARLSLPNDMKLNKPASHFLLALEKYMATGKADKSMAKAHHRPLRHSEPSIGLNLRIATETGARDQNDSPSVEKPSPEEDFPVFSPRLPTSNSFTETQPSRVFKLARKYSTRIKNRKVDGARKLKSMKDKTEGDDNSTTCTSDGAGDLVRRPRRINSVRLRRTNSSKIKKFQVMLDSDNEDDSNKIDSGVQQCDFDSGSDCTDIYERQTLAALESFTSDEEMRDSAIYSDAEELGPISPILQRDVYQSRLSNLFGQRARTLSPEKQLHPTPGSSSRYHGFENDDGDYSLAKGRGCWSLPRSNSLPNHAVNGVLLGSVEDIVSRPVSSNLLVRLEALKKSSTFEKEISADPVSKDTSVQQLTQYLQQRSSKAFSKPPASISVSKPESDSTTVTKIQRQLSSGSSHKLQRQASSDQILVGTGLVRQVKEKLQVN